MSQILGQLRQLASRYRLQEAVRTTPAVVLNRKTWAFREWLKPLTVVPVTIHLADGTRVWLSSDPLDDVVLKELWTTYRPLFFPEALASLPEDAVGLDVGAHHGAFAVALLQKFPRMQLICVEPDNEGFQTLSQNIETNQFDARCELVKAAIADRDGDLLFEQSDEGSWGNSVVTSQGALPVTTVRGISLATLLRGRQVDFVKSNCEGGEYSLIPQLLALRTLPRVIVLLLHPRNGEEALLLESLRNAGYDVQPTCTSHSHPRYVCVRNVSAT